MENKLKPVWSTELNEYLDAYFDEVYGIDIEEIICDAIQEAIKDETKKDEEKLK